jgi:hypothetical protein
MQIILMRLPGRLLLFATAQKVTKKAAAAEK